MSSTREAVEVVKFLTSDMADEFASIRSDLEKFDQRQKKGKGDVEEDMEMLTDLSIKHDRLLSFAHLAWHLPPNDQAEIEEFAEVDGGLDGIFEALEYIDLAIDQRIASVTDQLAAQPIIHLPDHLLVLDLLKHAKVELHGIELQIAEHRMNHLFSSGDHHSDHASSDKNKGHAAYWEKISQLHYLQRRVHHYHVLIKQNEKSITTMALVPEANRLLKELQDDIARARKNAVTKQANHFLPCMQNGKARYEAEQQDQPEVLSIRRAPRVSESRLSTFAYRDQSSGSSSLESSGEEDRMEYAPLLDARQ